MDKQQMQAVYELLKTKWYPDPDKPKVTSDGIAFYTKLSEPIFYEDKFGRQRLVFEVDAGAKGETWPNRNYVWFSVSHIPAEVLYLRDSLSGVRIANHDFSQIERLDAQPRHEMFLSVFSAHVLPRWSTWAIVIRHSFCSLLFDHYGNHKIDQFDSWLELRDLP